MSWSGEVPTNNGDAEVDDPSNILGSLSTAASEPPTNLFSSPLKDIHGTANNSSHYSLEPNLTSTTSSTSLIDLTNLGGTLRNGSSLFENHSNKLAPGDLLSILPTDDDHINPSGILDMTANELCGDIAGTPQIFGLTEMDLFGSSDKEKKNSIVDDPPPDLVSPPQTTNHSPQPLLSPLTPNKRDSSLPSNGVSSHTTNSLLRLAETNGQPSDGTNGNADKSKQCPQSQHSKPAESAPTKKPGDSKQLGTGDKKGDREGDDSDKESDERDIKDKSDDTTSHESSSSYTSDASQQSLSKSTSRKQQTVKKPQDSLEILSPSDYKSVQLESESQDIFAYSQNEEEEIAPLKRSAKTSGSKKEFPSSDSSAAPNTESSCDEKIVVDYAKLKRKKDYEISPTIERRKQGISEALRNTPSKKKLSFGTSKSQEVTILDSSADQSLEVVYQDIRKPFNESSVVASQDVNLFLDESQTEDSQMKLDSSNAPVGTINPTQLKCLLSKEKPAVHSQAPDVSNLESNPVTLNDENDPKVVTKQTKSPRKHKEVDHQSLLEYSQLNESSSSNSGSSNGSSFPISHSMSSQKKDLSQKEEMLEKMESVEQSMETLQHDIKIPNIEVESSSFQSSATFMTKATVAADENITREKEKIEREMLLKTQKRTDIQMDSFDYSQEISSSNVPARIHLRPQISPKKSTSDVPTTPSNTPKYEKAITPSETNSPTEIHSTPLSSKLISEIGKESKGDAGITTLSVVNSPHIKSLKGGKARKTSTPTADNLSQGESPNISEGAASLIRVEDNSDQNVTPTSVVSSPHTTENKETVGTTPTQPDDISSTETTHTVNIPKVSQPAVTLEEATKTSDSSKDLGIPKDTNNSKTSDSSKNLDTSKNVETSPQPGNVKYEEPKMVTDIQRRDSTMSTQETVSNYLSFDESYKSSDDLRLKGFKPSESFHVKVTVWTDPATNTNVYSLSKGNNEELVVKNLPFKKLSSNSDRRLSDMSTITSSSSGYQADKSSSGSSTTGSKRASILSESVSKPGRASLDSVQIIERDDDKFFFPPVSRPSRLRTDVQPGSSSNEDNIPHLSYQDFKSSKVSSKKKMPVIEETDDDSDVVDLGSQDRMIEPKGSIKSGIVNKGLHYDTAKFFDDLSHSTINILKALPMSEEEKEMFLERTLDISLLDVLEEQARMVINRMISVTLGPNTLVFAKYHDHYYSAIIESESANGGWNIRYTLDGFQKYCPIEHILPIDLLPRGQKCFRRYQSQENSKSIVSVMVTIRGHTVINGAVLHIAADSQQTFNIPHSHLSLQMVDAQRYVNAWNVTQSITKSGPELSLDNVIGGKRRRTPISSPTVKSHSPTVKTRSPASSPGRTKTVRKKKADPKFDTSLTEETADEDHQSGYETSSSQKPSKKRLKVADKDQAVHARIDEIKSEELPSDKQKPSPNTKKRRGSESSQRTRSPKVLKKSLEEDSNDEAIAAKVEEVTTDEDTSTRKRGRKVSTRSVSEDSDYTVEDVSLPSTSHRTPNKRGRKPTSSPNKVAKLQLSRVDDDEEYSITPPVKAARGRKKQSSARKGTKSSKAEARREERKSEDTEDEIPIIGPNTDPRLGTIPLRGCNLFKGYSVLITDAGTPKNNKREDIPPLSKKHLTEQLRNGGAKIITKFEEADLLRVRNATFRSASHSSSSSSTQLLLLCDRHCRTSKYIQCLAVGIPIVSHLWVITACDMNQRLSWHDYVLPAGVNLVTGMEVEQSLAVIKTGESSVRDSPLLEGDVVFIATSDNNQLTTTWLPLLANAAAEVRVLSEKASLLRTLDRKTTLVLADDSIPITQLDRAKQLGKPVVSSEWFIQSLVLGYKLPCDYHPSFSHDYRQK